MARTLNELLSVGELARMSWYIARGYAASYAKAQLRDRHPQATERTIDTVYRRAEQSYWAGLQLGQWVGGQFVPAPPETRLRAGAVPRGPGTGTGYGYTIDVTFTARHVGDPQTRTIRVRSDESLSVAELHAAARAELERVLQFKQDTPPMMHPQQLLEVTAVYARSVQRQ